MTNLHDLQDDSWFIEKIYEYILRKSQVFLLTLDGSGIIRFANTYAETIMSRNLVGVHLQEILICESWRESLLSEWADGEILPIMNIKTPDDLPRTLYVSVYARESGFLLFGHSDSEELVRLSKEVLQLNQELGNLTRELNVRNRELTELNTLKNQFLGMASHDLRNPVGIIMNYTEFLLEDLNATLSEQHRQFLKNIFSSAQDMKQVISDFLDVSIIESGHMLLNPVKVSYEILTREVCEKVRLSAERRSITIVIDNQETIPDLIVDKGKIEQVFVNLLNNAIEYSPDKAEITIFGTHAPEGVNIMVIDHGKGISPEKQEQLFREFSGTSQRKKDGERSIGLGLVISKKIIEAHGGTMYVKSVPQKGSTFGFILPKSCITNRLRDGEPGGTVSEKV